MLFGKNRPAMAVLIKMAASVLCCIILMFIHDLGYYIYTSNFTPKSKGVGLGFVSFYLIYVICPSLFVIPFTSFRVGVILATLVLLCLFWLWFSGNPYRVILIAMSGVFSYLVVFIMKKLIEAHFRF